MFACAAAAALVTTVLAYAIAEIPMEHGRLLELLQADAAAVNDSASAALTSGDRPLIRGALGMFRREPAVRSVTVYDGEGRLFVHLPLTTGATPAPERLAPGVAAQSAYETQSPSPLRMQMLVPVVSDGTRQGTLRVDVDLLQAYAPLQTSVACLCGALLFATLIAYVIVMRLRRELIEAPMHGLLDTLRRAWETQNFGEHVALKGKDDIAAIGALVNNMMEELEKRGRDLKVYRSELETRVRERTLRLDAAVVDVQETLEKAEAASRAKSEFLARMSHEIRTPMNAVLGMTELLRHATTLDDRQRRYADVIHQSGSALLGLINDILDFSKIEAGKLELDLAPFSLRDVVEEAVEILAEKAHGKGLELLCDIPPEVETAVFGDGQRLRQIIINLVGNAVKFTERGEVSVRVRQTAVDKHCLSYRIEVTDTGIGIKPGNSATIFESFAQEDNSTTRQYGGTGLGLAICRQLVELMGGQMGVDSEPGVGSTFHFTVVLASDPATVRGLRPAVLKGTRILIVDDNARARQILAGHLRSWGVIVTESKSPAVAFQLLEMAEDGGFQALVIDAQLPNVNESEFAKAIRNRADYEDVPILMMMSISMSASTSDKIVGPTGWISKPVRRAQLHSSLVALFTSQTAAPTSLTKMTSKRLPVITERLRQISRVRRALLVEDNPVNQEMTQAMLLELGVETVSAWSGEEALVKLAAEPFDVVLMDCQMPKLDGYAATRRVREWERRTGRERTAIVAVTANALNGDASRCFDAGMDRYLSKPFTIDQLFDILESCVPDGSPSVAGAPTVRVAAPPAPVARPMAPAPAQAPAVAANAPAGEAADSMSVAVLDEQVLNQIRQLQRGVPNLLSRMAELYVSNSTSLLEDLHRAVGANDLAAGAQAAHALKSTSYNAGAKDLAELCAKLEALCLQSRCTEVAASVRHVVREHARVKRALEELRSAA